MKLQNRSFIYLNHRQLFYSKHTDESLISNILPIVFQIIKTNNQEDVEEVSDMFVGLTLLHLACVFDQEEVLSYFLRYLVL